MGHIIFRAERNERADDALWKGFAIGASEAEVQRAAADAAGFLDEAESAHYLVILQAIRSLSEKGLSTRDIAKIVGISKSAVSRHLRSGVDGVAVRNSPGVARLVRQAWNR